MVSVEYIPDTELGGYTARLPGIPAYGEGNTKEEAKADLKEAVMAYLESYGPDETLSEWLGGE